MTSLLQVVPSGSIIMYGSSLPPEHWLLCDGSSYSKDIYKDLYNAIGDLYSSSTSSSYFNVPDLRDYFIRGTTEVVTTGTNQNDAIKNHQHETVLNGESAKFVNDQFYTLGFAGIVRGGDLLNRAHVSKIEITPQLTSDNIFDLNETRPDNIALSYIIKY